MQSQSRAVKAVNQEQLALYYGVGRYISANTRNKHWGSGMIKSISQSLRNELPGLRGFSETNLKNMLKNEKRDKRLNNQCLSRFELRRPDSNG